MPELPEVETIRQQLAKSIIGLKLQGKEIARVRRRGKILIFDFKDDKALIIHPKMTGQLIFEGEPSKHTRHIFKFEGGSQLIFNDTRRFGWWKRVKDTKKIERELGPEPLAMTLKLFKNILKDRQGARIKPLLMDQKFIAGIGNIYSDEILYGAKVHPLRRVKTLQEGEIERIFKNIKRILKAAIKHQGSSTRNFLDAFGQKGSYVKYHKVYQKEGRKCGRCGEIVKRIKVSGRSARFCPSCQQI